MLWLLYGKIPDQPTLNITYCIPYLQFYHIAVHADFFGGKLDSHCRVAGVREISAIVSRQQRALANWSISNQNILENVVEVKAILHLWMIRFIYLLFLLNVYWLLKMRISWKLMVVYCICFYLVILRDKFDFENYRNQIKSLLI